jgi:regulation of enolase protein 1 (concanavalin A-like superfamily)
MRLSPILIGLALVSSTSRAQNAMTVDTLTAVKEATTYLRTSFGADGPSLSGTGFLVRVEGTTGYLVTNAHVVTFPRGVGRPADRPTIDVIFSSGTRLESTAVGQIVATAPGQDLALLKVTDVAKLPRPLDLGSDIEPFETMTVYTFGFPFGQQLALGKGNPPVNVGRGQVSSVRRDGDDRLVSILLDGALNPGNSGGPVVDVRGKLVGVARATIRGANIGFAIAVPQLLDMLEGRAESPRFTAAAATNGSVDLKVEVPLLDPLGRIASARLLHTVGPAKFSRKPRPALAEPIDDRDDDDQDSPPRDRTPTMVFGPLEGAASLPLTLDRHQARGILTLHPPVRERDTLWCQVALVNRSGKTIHSQPRQYILGAGTSGKPTTPSLWGELVDPDGDCESSPSEGTLVIKVPGTLHDLNIDIGKNNAPRAVREVDGEFLAQVKVLGSFDPGPVRTGPKSVPYNGGGLLLWFDEGSYIRLERAAMYRNNRVVGFLAFESRDHGTRTGVHNKGGLDPHRDLWLRLGRRGGEISGSMSLDGKSWDRLEPFDVDWPSRLLVGVDAVNSCGDPMTVRFEHYQLTKPGDPAAGD